MQPKGRTQAQAHGARTQAREANSVARRGGLGGLAWLAWLVLLLVMLAMVVVVVVGGCMSCVDCCCLWW